MKTEENGKKLLQSTKKEEEKYEKIQKYIFSCSLTSPAPSNKPQPTLTPQRSPSPEEI